MKVDTGTQMDQFRTLIPFDFAKELQLFSEKHVLALRQATEKNGQVSKDFSVKDVRTMVDKTKRNLIETNKIMERTIDTQKKVVSYDQSCQEKQIALYKDKKALWEERILAKVQERDALMEKLRERKEFFRKIKENKELQQVILAEKKAEEEAKRQ